MPTFYRVIGDVMALNALHGGPIMRRRRRMLFIEERIPEVILRTCGNARITDEVRGSRGKEQYSNPAELWKMNASTP